MILKRIEMKSGSGLLVFSDRLVAIEKETVICRVAIGTDTFKEAQRIHSKLLDYPVVAARETRDTLLLPDWGMEATIKGFFPFKWVDWLSKAVEEILSGTLVLTPGQREAIALRYPLR